MAVRIKRGRGDEAVRAVKAALEAYVADHPGAEAEVYRSNPASIRVRVIDERFGRVPFDRRHDGLWDFLRARLSDDVMSEITFLIPVTPGERDRDPGGNEFDHPLPSRL